MDEGAAHAAALQRGEVSRGRACVRTKHMDGSKAYPYKKGCGLKNIALAQVLAMVLGPSEIPSGGNAWLVAQFRKLANQAARRGDPSWYIIIYTAQA